MAECAVKEIIMNCHHAETFLCLRTKRCLTICFAPDSSSLAEWKRDFAVFWLLFFYTVKYRSYACQWGFISNSFNLFQRHIWFYLHLAMVISIFCAPAKLQSLCKLCTILITGSIQTHQPWAPYSLQQGLSMQKKQQKKLVWEYFPAVSVSLTD